MKKYMLNIFYVFSLPFAMLLMGQKTDTTKAAPAPVVLTTADSGYIANTEKSNAEVERFNTLLKAGVAELDTDLATKEELASTVKVQAMEITYLKNELARIEQKIGLAKADTITATPIVVRTIREGLLPNRSTNKNSLLIKDMVTRVADTTDEVIGVNYTRLR